MTKSYYQYWGKTPNANPGESDFHLLVYHCLDVGAVGELYLRKRPGFLTDLSVLLEIDEEAAIKLLVFFLILHDLGKFTNAFQRLIGVFTYQEESRKSYNAQEFRHDRLGFYFWQKQKRKITAKICGINIAEVKSRDLAKASDILGLIAEAVFGHHGKPINTESVDYLKDYLTDADEQAVDAFIDDLFDLFAPQLSFEYLLRAEAKQRAKQASWYIAGWAVVMDWLGSDASFFKYKTTIMPLQEYWRRSQGVALRILTERDFVNEFEVVPFEGVLQTFGFEPTPLQKWAESVVIDNSPQMFILEDLTGAGKTEAALTLVHRLMQAGAAQGFYFGLPTMATSNAMFTRVSEHYLKILNTTSLRKPSIVLAHSAKQLSDKFKEAILNSSYIDSDYERQDTTASAQCNAWLADSNRKALLAPVGVGTIDQALLAVLPRRHQSVRLFGLLGKVLVIDEVHAADAYMFELLDSLLQLHFHAGGSVVLLTATLAIHQRQRLINSWLKSIQKSPVFVENYSFPLATKVAVKSSNVSDGSYLPLVDETPISARSQKQFEVNFLHDEEQIIHKIVDSVQEGKSVVWVRNSVDDAVFAYEQLALALMHYKDLKIILFHSRFVLKDRQMIEAQVLERLGKCSSDNRKNTVVIATQVFQESLDVDVDVMISDLCPIDDLIQRAGRLHRHVRNKAGVYCRDLVEDERGLAQLWVYAPRWSDEPSPDWLIAKHRNTELVYKSPARLWLGQKVLRELGVVRLPDHARLLIESVYSESALSNIPESFKHKELEYTGQVVAAEAVAQSSALDWKNYAYSYRSNTSWYEDDVEISTRLSEIRYSQVILLKNNSEDDLSFWYSRESDNPQLSILKMPERKEVAELYELPAHLNPVWEKIQQQYKHLKFVRPWLVRENQPYGYDATKGVYKCG
ncbi:MAG: CRISPR-associated helicase Cas3' [Pelistega sp.]|nr:CRISPR-associated helicase Cas3' [Pelistega sp.]